MQKSLMIINLEKGIDIYYQRNFVLCFLRTFKDVKKTNRHLLFSILNFLWNCLAYPWHFNRNSSLQRTFLETRFITHGNCNINLSSLPIKTKRNKFTGELISTFITLITEICMFFFWRVFSYPLTQKSYKNKMKSWRKNSKRMKCFIFVLFPLLWSV